MSSSLRPILVVLFLLLATLAQARADPGGTVIVDARFSGSWYHPERDGEGWMLEILSPNQALVYWFTYDEHGAMRWLYGSGRIQGDRIVFSDLVLTTGGRFGPDFDPDQVIRERAGSASMVFHDCMRGDFQYQAFGQQQTLPTQRLTSVLGLDCDHDGDPVRDRRSGLSGSWYDPDRNGEGYTLHWFDDRYVQLIWFSYGPDAQLYWMTGVGEEQADGSVFFPQMHSARGARFGADFDPQDVERYHWGQLRLELDCDQGLATFQSPLPGFGSGTYVLKHLTKWAGTECVSSVPPDWATATWSIHSTSGPLLSEMPVVSLGDFIYVAGGMPTLSSNSSQFWRYRPESDHWLRLADLPVARDHGMMAATDQAIYFFGGYLSGPFRPNVSNQAWRYDVAANHWVSIAAMPAPRGAGSAARLGDYLYVAGGSNNSHIDRYDPRADTWARLPTADLYARDHAILVAYENELWLLGGRDESFGFAGSGVFIFDPVSGQGRAGPSLPRGRSGFAAAVIDRQLIVTGGESVQPLQLIGGADLYSPWTGQWRAIANPPMQVHGGPAVAHRGAYYQMLGSMEAGGIYNLGYVQRLALPEP